MRREATMKSDKLVNDLTSFHQEEIQRQLKVQTSRDPQLWSIFALTLLVLASGLMAARDSHLLSQVVFCLVALVALFNVYTVDQRRTLSQTRLQLIQELSLHDTLARQSYLDPLTQAINRESMDVVVGRELTRANRQGTEVTFLLMEARPASKLGGVPEGQGTDAALLAGAGKLLRTTFRGLDIVVRYSHDTFLVVMPETNQQQAEMALRRLTNEIDTWNLSNAAGLELVLDHGMASYVKGALIEDVVRSAARKIALKKNANAPFLSTFFPGVGMSDSAAALVAPMTGQSS
jgi:diguanylate cyclase (GGDEF)-like protein